MSIHKRDAMISIRLASHNACKSVLGERFETCFADIERGPFRGSTHFYSDTCCSFQTMRAFPDRPINPFSLCHEAHFTVRAEFTKVSGSSSLQDGLTSLQGNNIYYNYGYLSASFGINWKYLVFYSDVYCFFNNSPCKNVCHFQEWRSLQVLNICIKK